MALVTTAFDLRPSRLGLRGFRSTSVQQPHHTVALPDPLCVSQSQAPIDHFEKLLRKASRAELSSHGQGILGFAHPCVCAALYLYRIRRIPRSVASRHHAPKHGTETVQVGPRAKLAVRDLLQRRVSLRVRSQRSAMLRDRLLRCAEVDQHRSLITLAHQDIRRLDVPMDHPRAVDMCQPLRQRNGNT